MNQFEIGYSDYNGIIFGLIREEGAFYAIGRDICACLGFGEADAAMETYCRDSRWRLIEGRRERVLPVDDVLRLIAQKPDAEFDNRFFVALEDFPGHASRAEAGLASRPRRVEAPEPEPVPVPLQAVLDRLAQIYRDEFHAELRLSRNLEERDQLGEVYATRRISGSVVDDSRGRSLSEYAAELGALGGDEYVCEY